MRIEPFKLERYFAQYEFNAPYLLCSSDCGSMSLGDLLEMEPGADEKFKDTWLGYTESQGDPVLRKAIAKQYEGISPDQVLVHTGAEEAIFNTMNAALKPGDHVIVLYPCYQSLVEIARSIGCEITYWKLENGPDWTLNLEFLEENIRPNTKLLVFNFPHNPTGYQLTEEELTKISRLSRNHGFYLFSDEVYRGLEYDKKDLLPSICEINESGLALGVMSKSFGLAGLRIGWIVTQNKELYRKLVSYKDYTTICNSAPSEFLSIIALKHRQQIIDRNLGVIKDNLVRLNDFFKRYDHLFNWKQPKAGPIAFPELKNGNVADFCKDLVDKAGVLLLPGTLYDEESSHFRVGFGRATMTEALIKLETYLESSGLGK
jgi:aspartate/methionine/tyrosine aminotransferase